MKTIPPLIGITTYGENESGDFVMRRLYIDAVRRAGGIPVLLTPGEEKLDALVDRIDGFVFSGGGDINPARHGGRPHDSIYAVDDERDRSELALAERILKQGAPVLAICRGLQILNTLLGGSLYEDIPSMIGNAVRHRLPPLEPARHSVSVEENSRLFSLLGKAEMEIASWHHQSIREPADGFKVVARAADGVPEALECEGYPNVIGIQWHPEITAAEDPLQQRLFNVLVEKAVQRMKN